MANGWTGNILRVNLTTGNITLEDSSKFKSFVGGLASATKLCMTKYRLARNLSMKRIN
ncbi:aldehyde ferredoxin oxidoreductase [Escherichia coli]|jgi:aldehyde:ferredoxin oxidoreductase|nr:aldehyde ferredoxin oxidoreductase [Escherichia coli]GCY93866.1 aldehyde ferredoxin oxidoreductase [Escherichia coli]VVY40533.1 putative oxidoreductase [Escherichia coli]VVY42514.1 putative oxidoreductase [Escherichia coli]VWM53437.1 putative oxidoreductase [Escherichia coli]